MYEHVPREDIIEALRHFRGLLRQIKPASDRKRLTAERREIVAKYLISNLRRIDEHPTLNTLNEVAETFSLTVGAAHELFGYSLDSIRQYDLRWNAGRTHIVESYVFDRDRLVDLPSELESEATFRSDAMLSNLVRTWHAPVPVRALDRGTGQPPGSFYVHVGTEEGQSSSLPPGSTALVEPVDNLQATYPCPRAIYLLQFGSGYRCSRCVITHGKLHLLATTRRYSRAQEFDYPGEVRIVGRVRMFAHALPQPEYDVRDSFEIGRYPADLKLPWEHATRDRLLITKERRFRRTDADESAIRDMLADLLNSPLSGRTERRYRHSGSSQPHVRTLIQLTLLHFARYSDVFCGGGAPINDDDRFTLATMLSARSVDDLLIQRSEDSLWPISLANDRRGREFLERSSLLRFKFPDLRLRADPVIRLSRGCEWEDLEPRLAAGSWMLLQPIAGLPDAENELARKGWSRPLYVLRRGLRFVTGRLERDSSGPALVWNDGSQVHKENLAPADLSSLYRVSGVAAPI